MIEVSVDESLIGKRLDIALTRQEGVSSRSFAQKMIKEGLVLLNGSTKGITPKTALKPGDKFSYKIEVEEETDIVPVEYDLDIVFEDEYLLVVNKPKGMVVHPAPGHFQDTMVNYLLHHTRLSEVNAGRPGIVHRIDKDTSGLLVVAKDNATHEHLAQQFFHHTNLREYQAIIWGIPEAICGTIDQPLGRHPVDRKKRAVREDGKKAITHWKTLGAYKYLSLVKCRLETGRTHQIRVHLASAGHPILGDAVYGKFRNFAKNYPGHVKSALKSYEGQALHARKLGFKHPKTDEWMEFSSPLPEEMQKVIDILEMEYNT